MTKEVIKLAGLAIIILGIIEIVATEHGIDGTFLKIICSSIVAIVGSIATTLTYHKLKERKNAKQTTNQRT